MSDFISLCSLLRLVYLSRFIEVQLHLCVSFVHWYTIILEILSIVICKHNEDNTFGQEPFSHLYPAAFASCKAGNQIHLVLTPEEKAILCRRGNAADVVITLHLLSLKFCVSVWTLP